MKFQQAAELPKYPRTPNTDSNFQDYTLYGASVILTSEVYIATMTYHDHDLQWHNDHTKCH